MIILVINWETKEYRCFTTISGAARWLGISYKACSDRMSGGGKTRGGFNVYREEAEKCNKRGNPAMGI